MPSARHKLASRPQSAAFEMAMTPYFSDPNFVLNFQSLRAMASKGGDTVDSQGAYAMTMTGPKTRKSA